jgi:hypothetical protein
LADSVGGLSGVGGASGESSPNQPSINEDPEWDFGDGKKLKRSEALKRIKNMEKGMHEFGRGRAEAQRKYEALTGVLSKFGITAEQFLADPDSHFDKAAQDRIARQMDEQLMDPKERALTQKERELAEREAKYKEWEENQQKTQREQRAAQRAEALSQEWAPALKQSGLPANAKTVARMAEVVKSAARQGVKLDPQEAADSVRDQLAQEREWHLNQYADPEALVSYLGPERLEAIRQYLVAKARSKQPQPAQKPRVATQPARDERTGKYIGWGEYRQAMRK